MRIPRWLESDAGYVRRLAEAGVSGVADAWNAPRDRTVTSANRNPLWVTTVLGGTAGALGALLVRRRKSGYNTAMGALVGSALGFGGGVAWTSRNLAGALRRSVSQKVNAVRDARWLEKNPIDYA